MLQVALLVLLLNVVSLIVALLIRAIAKGAADA